MKNKDNFLEKIGKSIKNLFIRLFGTGSSKNELDDELLDNLNKKESKALKEDDLVSPRKQIFKKFINNKVAIIGLALFTSILLFVVIGSSVITFNSSYQEGSQQYIQPKMGFTRIPRKLQKSGIKVITDDNGDKNYLIGGGNAFTIAISNDDKIYVWGADIDNIKDVPKEIKEKVSDIVQLSVGMRHAIVLTKDGEFLGWGANGFEQSQIPIFNEQLDSSYTFKKTIQAYFDPEARAMYPSSVVTTIETDPIAKIFAGPQTTTILTESGKVYSWGVTKVMGISEPNQSHGYLELVIRYDITKGLQWKFAGELNEQFKTLLTPDEVIAKYNLEKTQDGKDIIINYGLSTLRYRYDSDEEWVSLINKDDVIELIPAEKRNKTIVNVYLLAEQVAYEFSDNSFAIVGVETAAKYAAPEHLRLSAAERGFEVLEIVGTLKNNFLVTSQGNIEAWGDSDTSNTINKIPAEIQDKNIIDISSGSYHIVARDVDGKVYTWGYKNDLNQLDLPSDLDESEFITSNYFISISVSEEGEIEAWGNKGYIFGTDYVGADIFKRIIKGGSLTISLAAIAVIVSLIIGLVVGLLAGFYGGWIDNLLMRFGEIVNAFPFLPLAMTLAVLVTEMGLSDTQRMSAIMVILGLLSWPGLARLIRGQILAEREKDFVLAAKALGIKEKHIITRHILPNVINVVIVSTTLSYAGALLTESGLSFLGFGVKYPEPSWGNMLTGAQSMTVLRYYWWVWIIPALFIVLTALSINLIGDGLRDAMDPKASER